MICFKRVYKAKLGFDNSNNYGYDSDEETRIKH